MTQFFLVFLGGGLGAGARHLANLGALRAFGPGFPVGTMGVNIIGSLAMGLLVGWLARRTGGSSNELRLLLATGFLGGFTTFSAFSLDVAVIRNRGDTGLAAIYVMASVVLSIAGVFAGLWLVRTLG